MAMIMRVFLMLSILLTATVADRRPFDPNTETIDEYKAYLTKEIQSEREARTGTTVGGHDPGTRTGWADRTRQ